MADAVTGTETARTNNMAAFHQRLQASGLSRWELADFLGIHPHELDRTELNDLRERPVKVVIELARRLDMHPADLIKELDEVLANPRTIASDPLAPTGPPLPEPGTAADAMTLLSALAHAPYPLTAAELARTLSLGLTRVHAALDHIAAHPELGGPMALRRIPPQTYTLTPRVDILNAHQQSMIAYPRFPHGILAVEQADVLYAALAFGPLPAYTAYRDEHPYAEECLRQVGLIIRGPHGEVRVNDDVLFGLGYAAHDTSEYEDGWWVVDPPPAHPDGDTPLPPSRHRRAMRRHDNETSGSEAQDDYYGEHPRPPGRPR